MLRDNDRRASLSDGCCVTAKTLIVVTCNTSLHFSSFADLMLTNNFNDLISNRDSSGIFHF